jgi:hypothetical protein
MKFLCIYRAKFIWLVEEIKMTCYLKAGGMSRQIFFTFTLPPIKNIEKGDKPDRYLAAFGDDMRYRF